MRDLDALSHSTSTDGSSTWLNRLTGRLGYRYNDPKADGLWYWRERILFGALVAGSGLSLLALAPALYMAFHEERWTLLIADLVVFALVVSLLLGQRIRLLVRTLALLSINYLAGIFIILQMGFMSGGPAWLFAFPVFSGVFLGLRAALFATVINALTLVGLAWLGNWEFSISTSRAVAAGANFVFLNAVSAISVAVLVNGLETLNREARSATVALEEERGELLKTKEVLAEEITIRRKSETALQQSERSYRLLAENVKDIIFTMDLDLRFTYVSASAQEMLGWTPAELLAFKLKDIMTPACVEKVLSVLKQENRLGRETRSFEKSATLEIELYRKEGSTVWAEVTASFLLDKNHQPLGILGVARDITERLKTIREKEFLLESLNRSRKMEAVGTLAGGVAHDLNNVLSGIVSYPDLLLRDLPQDSPLRRPIEVIQESGKKAAAIVQDLLTLARRGVPVSEVVNLNDIVEEYLASPEFDRLQSFHPTVVVETRLDPRLLNIEGSPVHLSKTVMNLVSNAAEAMPSGGKIAITTQNRYLETPVKGLAEAAEGEYVVMEVSDGGVGISAEDVHRIFEPFYTKKKMGRSGTGLGMAVVWGTVQDHRGHIDVHSTEGKGTTVTLYLPASHKALPVETHANAWENYMGKGETVLVVDDIEEQREIAAKILEQLGYVAKSVSSGEEAVAFMQQGRADLVVLDMILNGSIDGLETYRRILEIHPHQKAIITSGFAETNRVGSAQTLGAGEYIRKPYTVETLAAAVKSELEKQSS
jgi:two-component system, cell cycle sensor histidine kinase and response regulator CckA